MTLTQVNLNIKIKIMVFSEITGPMKVKCYVELPCVRKTKFYAQNLGWMLNMATMLTNAQNLLLQNWWVDFHEAWYIALGRYPIIVCTDDDPRMTLTYFTARSILETGFYMGKSENNERFGNYCSLRPET